MTGRAFADTAYRFGFNGMEKDDEVKGEGNSMDYKFRMHDPRLNRFFSLDPLAKKFAHNSPFAFAENSPIAFVELEGLEKYFAADGSFLGTYGDNTMIRVVPTKYLEKARNFLQSEASISTEMNLIFLSGRFSNASSSEQSRIATTLFNMEVASKKSSEDSYKLYKGKVFINGEGLEDYENDNGVKPIPTFKNAGASASYYSKKSGEGVISINSVVDEYYNMVKAILHEDIHNRQTKHGINTWDPKNHFDVEWDAFNSYKNEIDQDSDYGMAHTKQLLSGYLDEMAQELNSLHKKEGFTDKYRQKYTEYSTRKAKYEKEFSDDAK